MYTKTTLFVFACIGLQQVAFGSFFSECEKGIIDVSLSLKNHMEENFPEIAKKSSQEMASIYAYALKLVKNKNDEDTLKSIYGGIQNYLRVCKDIFNFTTALSDSADKVNLVLEKMKVDEICTKETNGEGFVGILRTPVVKNVLTLEYFDQSYSAILNSGAKILNGVMSSAMCILRECPTGIGNIFKNVLGDIAKVTTTFMGDVLQDVDDSLNLIFGTHFSKQICQSNEEFKLICDELNEEIEEVKRKMDRVVRSYMNCVDDKSDIARKVKNFKSMKVLLKVSS